MKNGYKHTLETAISLLELLQELHEDEVVPSLRWDGDNEAQIERIHGTIGALHLLNRKLSKRQSVPLNDAAHPARQAAIKIIEGVIEPLIKKGINGEKYYALEDQLTEIIGKIPDARNAEPEDDEFLVIGSNNFWYATDTTLKNAIATARAAKKDHAGFADPETGHEPEKPETFYIYKARQMKEL